jgi:hypothetical protein
MENIAGFGLFVTELLVCDDIYHQLFNCKCTNILAVQLK